MIKSTICELTERRATGDCWTPIQLVAGPTLFRTFHLHFFLSFAKYVVTALWIESCDVPEDDKFETEQRTGHGFARISGWGTKGGISRLVCELDWIVVIPFSISNPTTTEYDSCPAAIPGACTFNIHM